MNLSQACKDNNIYAYRNSNVNVLENGNLGLLVKRKGQYHIIYDDEKSRNVSIATILHELGHYYLGHLESGNDITSIDEMMAEMFATVILALEVYDKYKDESTEKEQIV